MRQVSEDGVIVRHLPLVAIIARPLEQGHDWVSSVWISVLR